MDYGLDRVQNPNDVRLQNLGRGSQAVPSNDRIDSIEEFQDNSHLGVAQNGPMQGLRTTVETQGREYSDDDKSFDVRSEHTFIQRRDLGVLDVAALIINKQIGIGIFTTPGLVLGLTGNKTISTVLWFCGGFWALIGYVQKEFLVLSYLLTIVQCDHLRGIWLCFSLQWRGAHLCKYSCPMP